MALAEREALQRALAFFDSEGWQMLAEGLRRDEQSFIDALVTTSEKDDYKRGRIRQIRDVLGFPDALRKRISELKED